MAEPTKTTAAGVKIPRDAMGGDIAGPDAKAKARNVDNSGLTKDYFWPKEMKIPVNKIPTPTGSLE